MRVELRASVRSVRPDDCSPLSVVIVRGRQVADGSEQELQLELSLRDDQARAFAARYHEDGVVRVTIEVDDSPPRPAGLDQPSL